MDYLSAKSMLMALTTLPLKYEMDTNKQLVLQSTITKTIYEKYIEAGIDEMYNVYDSIGVKYNVSEQIFAGYSLFLIDAINKEIDSGNKKELNELVQEQCDEFFTYLWHRHSKNFYPVSKPFLKMLNKSENDTDTLICRFIDQVSMEIGLHRRIAELSESPLDFAINMQYMSNKYLTWLQEIGSRSYAVIAYTHINYMKKKLKLLENKIRFEKV